MDLQPSQHNYSEGDRLQISESLSRFFSRMTVSNKTMERIMRQDSNLSPYDGFRIGGIGKVLNQIGLNQRKHHIMYKVSSGEFAIPMEFTGNVMEMQLIPKEEILEELNRLREEVAVTMKWIHIGTIEVVRKATFKKGIDSEIHLSIMDRRINNLIDGCLGTMIGNLYAGKLMFDIHPRIAYNLADQDFSKVLTLHQDFKRKDLMKEGNRPYSITYRIAYALSNTHHSDLFLRKEYIEIPRIFKEFAKVMAPDPIRIPKIGGVDIVIKDHRVLDRTISSRTEFSSRMSFSEYRIMIYKGKEKDLLKAMTPQEIRQPVVGRYEGMLEIAGHEILVAGVAGRENGSMTLGLSFLEDHKPWGRKGNAYIDSGSGICTAKPGVFPKEAKETLPVIAGRDFSQKILILNTGIREAKIMIGGAFGTPWFRVLRREKAFNRIMPINFRSKLGDFDAKLTHPKMQDKRKFGKVLLSFRQQGLIDRDSFYNESEGEIKNLKEALEELKTMDISEESKLSLKNVKRLIRRNFSENPLAWWDRNKIEATIKIQEECKYEYVRYKPIQMNMEDKKDMQMIIKEHINLGLIEPGISAYSSPGFLEHIVEKIRNFPDILKDKKHLQSFLGVVCNNLPKLAIPQDEDELVVYTDANDYRWAAVLMKKTTTGEEPCRYTGGLFIEQQAQVWHINEKEFFAIAIRTTMVASTSLWNDLQEPIRKASSSEMTNELRKHDPKHALRVQDSRPIAADSSSACTRPPPDSGVTATNESQGVQTSDDSSQPSASGVKEEEISLRPITGTSKANTNELSSSSSACQRPDMVAFNRIKVASEEAPLVSAISEDDISTRRAWGLWVCLTEMDKVKYPFKIFSNKVNGSFLLNSMIGKSTEFAESMFEKKRMLVWENKLPATKVTRMKTCNMLHVGQWHNHVCPYCEKQEKPLFGTKIRVTQKKPEPTPDKGKRKNFYKEK
ncbi:UNVERIFIED_CONTAM: movement protein [Sesamum radiatum]|uniref:Movement protein n=1 Tax=Sesamum radiatum TaxID=300843 RepID=A0AAW2WMA6_SESRA